MYILGEGTNYLILSSTKQMQYVVHRNGVIDIFRFLIDDIFVDLGGHYYQQIIGIPMGSNCTPLIVKFSFTPMIQSLYKNLSKELQKLKALISHSGILMIFCQFII